MNRLKNLKRKEIEDKFASIMKQSGATHMPFTEEELDEDFDPEEHDRKMTVQVYLLLGLERNEPLWVTSSHTGVSFFQVSIE